jgi:hypothetical protein
MPGHVQATRTDTVYSVTSGQTNVTMPAAIPRIPASRTTSPVLTSLVMATSPAACRLPPAACRLPPAACRLPPAATRGPDFLVYEPAARLLVLCAHVWCGDPPGHPARATVRSPSPWRTRRRRCEYRWRPRWPARRCPPSIRWPPAVAVTRRTHFLESASHGKNNRDFGLQPVCLPYQPERRTLTCPHPGSGDSRSAQTWDPRNVPRLPSPG